MTTLGKRIRELRKEKGLTQEDLGKLFNLRKSTISQYESSVSNPDYGTLQRFADYFNVSIDFLLGRTDSNKLDLINILENKRFLVEAGSKPISQEQRLKVLRVLNDLDTSLTTVPILGTIKVGIPILSEENYEGELEIPPDIVADFAVMVSGDSMIGAGILPGDYILCKKDTQAYNRDIVAAALDGEVTLKYLINNEGRPVLRAANPEYEDIPVSSNNRVEGIMVALFRKEATPYHHYQAYIASRDYKLQEWDEIIEKAVTNGLNPSLIQEIIDSHIEMAKRFAKERT